MIHLPISFQIPLIILKTPNGLREMLDYVVIRTVPARLRTFLSLALVALGLCSEVSIFPVGGKS